MLPSTHAIELKPALAVTSAKGPAAKPAQRQAETTSAVAHAVSADVAAPLSQHRVVSQHANAWFFHDANQISRFFSANKYTCFIHEGLEHYATESLSALEARLGPLGFMRTHRADLINLRHIRSIKRVRHTFEITLQDGQCVLASRRLVQALRVKLGF